MSPEAQRIAIAERVGFSDIEIVDGRVTAYKHIEYDGVTCFALPNYLNGLNAMHEVEKTLSDSQWLTYESELERIVDRDNHHLTIQQLTCAQIHATASQRAEAYLKTINKWSDDQ